MMDLLTLSNLLAWCFQTTLLTVASAVAMNLLKVDAPVIRHACWRTVLLICLALPLVQPWQPLASIPLVGQAGSSLASASPDLRALPVVPPISIRNSTLAPSGGWLAWAGLVLAAGAAARLVWIVVGLLRLRRLRRTGEPAAPDGGYDELRALIQAGAEIRYVPAVGQPVTFGVFRPVVLLPDAMSAMAPRIQRAVLAHELWHVRRGDWTWAIAEEIVRAVCWFNPALWWLISRVQSTREEVVDELTVMVTNGRRGYLEALLAFADEPALFPAAPFARRRHLFHRMLLISREAAMSSRRIVVSSAALIVVVLAAGWYGVSAFPLQTSTAQNPPRDRRPGEAAPETARERELKKAIETTPANTALYLELARLQEAREAKTEAETTLLALRQAKPNDRLVLSALASFYNRAGQFEQAIAALEEAAALDPSNPQGHQLVAVFYFEKAQKDRRLMPIERLNYIQAGIAATDRALTYQPDYMEALTYKSILLRLQAGIEPDSAKKQQLIAEADVLRNRALEISKARGGVPGGVPGGVAGGVPGGVAGGPPPPPPPPPPPLEPIDGQMPIRVGGNVKQPTKIKDVKPVYPAEAMDAKVQGVVILEVLVDAAGFVRTAKVLRGQPLLDQAAIDAVTQWEFTPTLLNNAPVPVVMTVTVNFTLQ
jgi:TonB family protein